VVRRYLQPTDRVLDVGTGGGERFLDLAPHFGQGIGIDIGPQMVKVARENRPEALREKVSFEVMPAETLAFPDRSFDLVLNRHSVVVVDEVLRVLRAGGYFITQQVGARNTHNICSLFGCGPGGQYEHDPADDVTALAQGFEQCKCWIVCQAVYDVRYWFLDIPSLIFWHQAIPIPEDFDIEKHGRLVEHIIDQYSTSRGVETNEHRELLIVQKR
jgi:SAM-dependent methyltransferase